MLLQFLQRSRIEEGISLFFIFYFYFFYFLFFFSKFLILPPFLFVYLFLGSFFIFFSLLVMLVKN